MQVLAVTLTLKIANIFFFSAWHSGSFCCITIPSLVTKYFMVQKISSRQTFTDIFNLCCDLDLKHSNPIFAQDTLAYDAALSYQVWLQTDQQFRRYSSNSLYGYISPCCDLDVRLRDSKPIFLHDTLTRDAALPYQVWYQNGLRFRGYHPGKHSLTFWTFAVTLTLNTVIPFFHRTLCLMMLYIKPSLIAN